LTSWVGFLCHNCVQLLFIFLILLHTHTQYSVCVCLCVCATVRFNLHCCWHFLHSDPSIYFDHFADDHLKRATQTPQYMLPILMPLLSSLTIALSAVAETSNNNISSVQLILYACYHCAIMVNTLIFLLQNRLQSTQ